MGKPNRRIAHTSVKKNLSRGTMQKMIISPTSFLGTTRCCEIRNWGKLNNLLPLLHKNLLEADLQMGLGFLGDSAIGQFFHAKVDSTPGYNSRFIRISGWRIVISSEINEHSSFVRWAACTRVVMEWDVLKENTMQCRNLQLRGQKVARLGADTSFIFSLPAHNHASYPNAACAKFHLLVYLPCALFTVFKQHN